MTPQRTDRPIACESLDGLRRRALEAAVAAGVSEARLRALIAAGRPTVEIAEAFRMAIDVGVAAGRAATEYAAFAALAYLDSPTNAN